MSAEPRAEMERLARQLWGEPTGRRRDSLRFGARGSKAVDLRKREWFDFEAGEGGGLPQLYARAGETPPKANGSAGRGMNIAATYDYRDESGALLFQVVRLVPKKFPQRRPDPGAPGGWSWKLGDVRRVLYRLPELIATDPAQPVFIVEGEKDCDNVRALGLVATCNPGGASEGKGKSKWRPEYGEHLRGRDAVILPDNDDTGRAHAKQVFAALKNVARSVRVIELPDLPDKGDVSNWIEAGGTADALLKLARDALETTDRGDADDRQNKPRRNTLALVAFLAEQAKWQGALAINQLTETIEIALRLPSTERCERRPLVDADVLEAMLYFQAHGFPKATKGLTLDALTVVAQRNAYHPVRNYLATLRWDGVGRIRRLFRDYFNADVPAAGGDSEHNEARDRQVAYLEHVAECSMVSAVARIMEPGCKVDHVPVLVGPQGIGKSTALRALCHDPAWFTDDVSANLGERDTKESLRGKWLIELAEIPHVRREAERVKAFITRRADRYREAYGMINRDHPRQSVFIGTSNDLEFVDATGNRRFWPVRLADRRISVCEIEAVRDQLWAEAVTLYHDGMQWWLPPQFEAIAAEVQDAFTEHDLWEDLIQTWLQGRADTPFTMADLFAAGTGIMPFKEAAATTKAEQMRAARCLARLGYERRQSRRGGQRGYWWQKSAKVLKPENADDGGDGGDT